MTMPMSMTSMPAARMPSASAADELRARQAAVAADGDRVAAALARERAERLADRADDRRRERLADDAADVVGLEDFGWKRSWAMSMSMWRHDSAREAAAARSAPWTKKS